MVPTVEVLLNLEVYAELEAVAAAQRQSVESLIRDVVVERLARRKVPGAD